MTEHITGKTLQTVATFNAPLEIVWDAWTKPEQIATWWGPAGFTNTIHKMDLREGGEWRLTMHSANGQNFPNRSIFKEIIPLGKIVFEHFNPHFMTTVMFERDNDKTIIDWSLEFDSPEMFDIIVKAHKADRGQRENVEKLEKYLEGLRPKA
ncbi:SRPBCC domain-containing protein [Terrimonas ferruginea]|uniref:SRPBCC domain-containing protein n=1 Tax=Terrimonas ferruginea TaxID=249 RepID=UPI00048C7C21|nr:SRPBCC domain-containing protein [Terrimonas ferruginea]